MGFVLLYPSYALSSSAQADDPVIAVVSNFSAWMLSLRGA
jgi:hypothetical protein